MVVPKFNMLSLPLLIFFAQVVPAELPSITHQQARGELSTGEALEFFQQRHNITTNLANFARSSNTTYRPGLDIFEKRTVPGAGALLCSLDKPCVDDSCCSIDGICGFGPDYCGTGCSSKCNATAMCGQYAAPGDEKCGMNICCSKSGWCGTSIDHCIGPDKFSLCQPEYGSCEMKLQPGCDMKSASAKARTIGYYQASNVRNRACNQITPGQIDTTNYTHLTFAFASIDPTTFKIVPATSDDIPLFTQFTALKSAKLQTWIAVGGFDFSDPGPTHTTWSDLCASASHRQVFIQSLIDFMNLYKFDGVDIDWEYPGDPTRGGGLPDRANFVSLIQEMSASFNGKFGISVTLAPDYWYLRWFDAKAMEPYVSWFGFMAYDLHGAFDSTVKTLAPTVRGQADIREITNDTLPLWYDGLDPQKINFGVAWYGRGYTLADPSCNTMGCAWTGPSRPGKCTGSPGVMSLNEINDKIKELGIAKPKLNADAYMKELTFDDQWIGYDDEETIELKTEFASAMCFGGTMAWSVDFHSGEGNSDDLPVSKDGQCGLTAKATCKGSGFGDCCSSSGWCGSDDGHCASGCDSTYGSCTIGGVTTDGTCGAGHNEFTCGSWLSGSCCSASGYCGGTDAYCGTGCQGGCANTGDDCEYGSCLDGSKVKELWETYTCQKDAATNSDLNPKDRWEALNAWDAWAGAVNHWMTNDRGKTSRTFIASISHYLGGPIGMACGVMASNNGCNAIIQSCTSVKSPAGYLILNSLIAIQSINWNFWDSVDRKKNDIVDHIDNLEATFAPVPKESLSSKIIMDVFAMGFAMSAAPFWNSNIKKFDYWGNKENANTLGTTKDSINSMVSNGVTISKDAIGEDGGFDPAKELKSITLSLMESLANGMDKLNKEMFSGSDEGIDMLTNLIDGGKTMPDNWGPSGDPEIMHMIERAFYMTLIPIAWTLTADGDTFGPVVIDSGHECRATNTEPPFDDEYGALDEDAYTNGGICYDNRQYFLVGAAGEEQDCSSNDPGGIGGSIGCQDRLMSQLPGTEELTGGDAWGGLSKQDFAISSILSFQANGNKNGWGVADPSQTSFYKGYDWDDNDMRRPGLSSIPVCGVAEVEANWQKFASGQKLPSAHYPCN